jgi:hypothetical protein
MESTVQLTPDQQRAIDHGQPVPVTLGQTECVVVRRDVYEKSRDISRETSEVSHDDLRAIFARGIESSDWNDPTMDVYDEYEKHKP